MVCVYEFCSKCGVNHGTRREVPHEGMRRPEATAPLLTAIVAYSISSLSINEFNSPCPFGRHTDYG